MIKLIYIILEFFCLISIFETRVSQTHASPASLFQVLQACATTPKLKLTFKGASEFTGHQTLMPVILATHNQEDCGLKPAQANSS
jgi:hypothetical protein